MDQNDDMSGIADASHPNPGRIYDYLLGGDHNFEIDRQAAQNVLEIAPFFPKAFRLIRWFLGEATRRLSAEGYHKFLDFASGLPTVDHIHQVAPEGTKVVYSDIDPVTVAYAQQIIGDDPNIRYMQADARNPETLLESKAVSELFGDDRKLVIGFNGVGYFLSNEVLSRSLKTIYDRVETGSRLFICDNDVPKLTGQARKMVTLYKEKMNQEAYIRSRSEVEAVVKPWTILKPGFIPLEDWIGLDRSTTDEMSSAFGGTHIGAILEKR